VNPCFLLDEVEYPIERQPGVPSQRNLEIHRRYAAGERAIELAAEYEISWQRVYQIIEQVISFHGGRNRGDK
jgi:Mor family transcriptional regulator